MKLELRVVLTTDQPPQVRPFVDGRDLLADEFTKGPGEQPERLLRPEGPLLATPEPREVRLAVAECTEGCCGALYVTVATDGEVVTWTGWRNPDATTTLPGFRFDAAAYRAEVERATADLSWEWPARTVARLLKQQLSTRGADWLARWQCELTGVSAFPRKPEELTVFLYHPGLAAMRESRAWLQFRLDLPVTAEDPAVQAEAMAARLLAADPRQLGQVCGGSAEHAAELGYAWR